MDWLYELFINAASNTAIPFDPKAASWGVVLVVLLCVYSIFKLIIYIFGGNK